MISIVCFTGNSGLTDYTVSLASALAKKDKKVEVVTAESLDMRFAQRGFDVQRIFRRSRHLPIDYIKLIFLLLGRDPSVLLFQSWLKFALIDAFIVRGMRLLGWKTLVVVHDTLPHYPRPWSKAMLGFYYRSFDAVVTHSKISSSQLRGMGVAGPILQTKHGQYDIFKNTVLTKAEARERLGLLSEGYIVLYFGHIETRKGCLEFMQTAATYESHGIPVQFVMAGRNDLSGVDKEKLELYRDLPNVVLRDSRIDFDMVQYYFVACDLVALPYLEGTTSGVLKLAVAFDRPALATPHGDLADAVESGFALRLDPENLVDSMRSQVKRAASGELSTVKLMAALSLERKETDWNVIADQYLSIMDELRTDRSN
jgi:glycosyltransferase involved in cell wall biosynthesis